MSFLRNHNLVNEGVAFDPKLGKPVFTVKEKGSRIRVSCTFVGGDNRDDGFLVGTYFTGKLKERDGAMTLTGVAVTSPLFHLILLGLTVLFILKCIELGGFSVVPLVFLAISILMFGKEYKKQGVIKRYLYRAMVKCMKAKEA